MQYFPTINIKTKAALFWMLNLFLTIHNISSEPSVAFPCSPPEFNGTVLKTNNSSTVIIENESSTNIILCQEWIEYAHKHRNEITTLIINKCVPQTSNQLVIILKPLLNLKVLHLTHMELVYFNLDELENHMKLTSLTLDHNPGLQLTGKTYAKIKEVSMKNCSLKSFPEALFQFNSSLIHVDLRNNQISISSEELQKLEKQLPTTKIDFGNEREIVENERKSDSEIVQNINSDSYKTIASFSLPIYICLSALFIPMRNSRI